MKIEIKNVSKVYPGGKCALKDINLCMASPNMIGLLGPNGAGKSTMMKLLTGALTPSKGSILVDDVPLPKCEKTFKAQLGYLPQSFGLYDELTVYQFLDYIASLKSTDNRKEEITKVLELTNLMEKRKCKIRTLSGGQRQRVGIAQALLGDAPFIVLDEPTVGLDPEERVYFRNIFSNLSKDKIVLLSTHIIEDIQAICNQIIVIHEGGILFQGTPEDLTNRAKNQAISEKANSMEMSPVSSKEPSLEDAYMYLMKTKEE